MYSLVLKRHRMNNDHRGYPTSTLLSLLLHLLVWQQIGAKSKGSLVYGLRLGLCGISLTIFFTQLAWLIFLYLHESLLAYLLLREMSWKDLNQSEVGRVWSYELFSGCPESKRLLARRVRFCALWTVTAHHNLSLGSDKDRTVTCICQFYLQRSRAYADSGTVHFWAAVKIVYLPGCSSTWSDEEERDRVASIWSDLIWWCH